MSDNVVDIIARNVIEKVGDEIEARTQAAVQAVSERVQIEAQRRIDAAVADIPTIAFRAAQQAVPVPVQGELVIDEHPDAKSDARDRAWRTLAQGLVVTVILAIITAFGTAVAAPEFDLLTWDSWRAAATAGGTAAVMAVAAYIQRLISPPKAERLEALPPVGR